MCSKKMVFQDFFANIEIKVGHYSAIISERYENKHFFGKTHKFLINDKNHENQYPYHIVRKRHSNRAQDFRLFLLVIRAAS